MQATRVKGECICLLLVFLVQVQWAAVRTDITVHAQLSLLPFKPATSAIPHKMLIRLEWSCETISVISEGLRERGADPNFPVLICFYSLNVVLKPTTFADYPQCWSWQLPVLRSSIAKSLVGFSERALAKLHWWHSGSHPQGSPPLYSYFLSSPGILLTVVDSYCFSVYLYCL